MTPPRLTYDTQLPAEIRAAVAPVLERYLHLVPGWCQTLTVGWDGDDTTGTLRSHILVEYRAARIVVLPAFVECDDVQRDNAVLHELTHIPLEQLRDVAYQLLGVLKETHPALEGWAKERIRVACESATCDVTHMLELARDTLRGEAAFAEVDARVAQSYDRRRRATDSAAAEVPSHGHAP